MHAKHTPGPWMVYDGIDAQYTLEAGWAMVVQGTNNAGCIVANVNLDGGPRFCEMPAMANARLIAAAPDLMEALELAEERIVELQNIAANLGGCRCDSGQTLDEVRAALAKARGES